MRWIEAQDTGELFAQRQREGEKPPVIDSLLAATSLTHGLTFVTRNEADFIPLGVDVLNPWTQA